MESPSPWLYIAIAALLGCSAFFSASETAISTHNKIRLKKKAQDGDERAKRAVALANNYERTITSILIGNNIVNIAASTIATLIFTALLGGAGAVVSTIVMTLLVLIFGEIIPKSYSQNNADKVALSVSGALRVVNGVLRPLTALFTKFTGGFARDDEGGERTPTITEEELHYFIESIEEEGVLEEEESNLVQSALEFDETPLREIVTPRVKLVALDVNATQEEIRRVLLENTHTNIPVYEESIDSIVGVLGSREALQALVQGEEVDLRARMREPYYVHKNMTLTALLGNIKVREMRLAIVLDEYGGTMGVVTMSDLFEELVDDVWDQELPEGMSIRGVDSYVIQGGCDLDDMLEELDLEEDEESDYATVNGWAMHQFEHIPEVGESFQYGPWRFAVLELDGHRIEGLSAERLPERDPEDGAPDEKAKK